MDGRRREDGWMNDCVARLFVSQTADWLSACLRAGWLAQIPSLTCCSPRPGRLDQEADRHSTNITNRDAQVRAPGLGWLMGAN